MILNLFYYHFNHMSIDTMKRGLFWFNIINGKLREGQIITIKN